MDFGTAVMTNGGWFLLLSGMLTEGDILTVVPFDNKMVRVTMLGSVVKEMLETSVKGYRVDIDRGKGGFLQVSGERNSCRRKLRLFRGNSTRQVSL